tara:strand:- start:81 stop:965 length:885 start_codon:yes stop_codon:yes gene_type:complete
MIGNSINTKMYYYLVAMRVPHYIKNTIIFVPSFFNLGVAINYNDLIISFISLCFAASAGYLINDANDIKTDKNSYLKKKRVLVTKKVSLISAKLLSFFLIIISLFLSYLVGIKIFYLVLIYIGSTFLYTYVIKKIIFLDIIFLSFFYVLRMIMGVIISGQSITIWLLILSFIFFLNFSAIKRLVDINNYIKKDKSNIYNISSSKKLVTLIYFFSLILPIIAFTYLFWDAYIFESIGIGVLLTIIISIWITFISKLAFNKKIQKDFITFIFKDIISQITFLICAILLTLNIYLSY